MQTYIHAADLRYPLTANDIKAEHPNTSFPQYLQPADIIGFGYFPVIDNAPSFDPATQHLVEGAPIQVSNEWRKGYVVTDYTAEELAAQAAAKAAAEAAAAEAAKQAMIVDFTTRIQARLDTFAKTRLYYDILSACTYSNSTNAKFKGEADYCIVVRDETWATCYQILDEVNAGTRPAPTWAELEAELPVLEWPA